MNDSTAVRYGTGRHRKQPDDITPEAAELLGTIAQTLKNLPKKQEAAWRKARA